ncbi:sugar/nucleoside kinase (ribokinase family) [Murinocardiopsis flavida]|uniref:Sugar/nucleoside kinase (Ribokinase family) n=1 Tax=Murinocardiopsis flavida TaxID=645275 RepID=A0A2P8DQV3_9ACTN|nr:PfkB family carbohydrate kinase [Murinocardiopsis flavida]PSK99554.1 sugar/nucleoside kinase (ribokinase family) [Murinocardiopsis flavida]
MSRLVHCGAVITDLVMTVDAVPPVGGDVFARSATATPGAGFNVMAAAARSGMRVLYAGAHGTGRNGDMARAAMAAEGIGVAHPRRTDMDTGFCVALVDADAERTFVTSLGAEGHLAAGDLARVATAPGDFVYLVGYSLVAGPYRTDLVEWAEALPEGVRLVFDPAPVVADIPADLWGRVLGRVDLLTLNAREARLITGLADTGDALAALVGDAPRGAIVVLRDAAAGCLVAAPGREPVRVPGRAVAPVDTNGAGDAHVGAFLAALARGADPVAAARRANAAAAISVTRTGPATAPDTGEIDRFLTERAGPVPF